MGLMKLTKMFLVLVLASLVFGKSAWALTPTKEAEEIVTLSPTTAISVEPTVPDKITETQSENDLSKWFLFITIGLLALIITVQVWPEKKEKIE